MPESRVANEPGSDVDRAVTSVLVRILICVVVGIVPALVPPAVVIKLAVPPVNVIVVVIAVPV